MKTKLLLYCTKNKWRLFFDMVKQIFTLGKVKSNNDLNGKIVAECDYEVEDIYLAENSYEAWLETKTLNEEQLRDKSCLSVGDLYNYLDEDCGYAIHIKNLHIFDKPKELSDYYTFNGIVNNANNWEPVNKAPQNMMYAYDLISELGLSGTYNTHLIKNIIISIRPEWMCLILNRVKDIEVRKVVLKEMLR